MLTNLIDRLWSMLDPYELPDDADLLGSEHSATPAERSRRSSAILQSP